MATFVQEIEVTSSGVVGRARAWVMTSQPATSKSVASRTNRIEVAVTEQPGPSAPRRTRKD